MTDHQKHRHQWRKDWQLARQMRHTIEQGDGWHLIAPEAAAALAWQHYTPQPRQYARPF